MPRKPTAGQAASRTTTSRQRRPKAAGTAWRRGLFEDAAVGVALLDLAGIVVDCNAAFSRTLRARRESVIRRPLAEHFGRNDQDDLSGQFSKLVMGTLRRVRIEGLRRAGSGSNRRLTLFAVSVGAPQPAGLVVHLFDGSDRQSDAAALLHAQKMQAIGQLAGGIAHDFNNLLTAMVGFCELLLVRHPVNDPSHADIAEIRSNATRASHLVRQLLAFSRKQSLKPETVNVAEALAELATMLRRLLGPTIDLRLQDNVAAGESCLVRVDPVQFDQVIINLAVNARDAMPSGGTLILRTSPVSIESAITRGSERMPAGSYVRIDVIDSGVGIPKEILGNIFEPFFTTKQPGAGTGLGLSTVYGIVRQTEGFIFVDSAPGEGTHFSIYLPASPSVEMHALPTAADAETRPARSPLAATVLLVDDERPVRMVAARALQQEGYRVIEAESGEDAIELIRGHDGRIDLLLTDVVMPGIDGFTLARLARQDRPRLQTIVMSGYSEDTLNATGDGSSGVHFLQKPFTLAELTSKVSQLAAQTR